MLFMLSGLATVCGTMALIIVNSFRTRIESNENYIKKVDDKTQQNTVAVSKAIDEPRVRDILHEELSDIRKTTKSTDDKVSQLMLSQLNNANNPNLNSVALAELADVLRELKGK